MSPNAIYAEYLPNIGQISIHVSLASTLSNQTTIRLNSGCDTVILRHYSDEISCLLPYQVATNTSIQIPHLEPNSRHFSLRLQAKRISQDVIANFEEEAPWSAGTLDCQSDFVCRLCKEARVVGPIKLWRNLPSEHWVEMMDFWHCHKPGSATDDSLVEEDEFKVYAASNKLTARRGVGFVSKLYFVVHTQDCLEFEVSHAHMEYSSPLFQQSTSLSIWRAVRRRLDRTVFSFMSIVTDTTAQY